VLPFRSALLRRIAGIALLMTLVALTAGCGSSGSNSTAAASTSHRASTAAGGAGSGAAGAAAGRSRAVEPVSLVLDFTPNPVHVGIYEALAHHDDTAAGLALHVIVPSASTDAVQLLEAGRVDFAILDIHDLAIARQRGLPIVGLVPIVQRPLAAVIAAPDITSPRQLDGRTVGVTGAPSDTAVLDSIVAGAGGRPATLHPVTIGYDAVSDLLVGRVTAATAFWNDEGVTLQRRRPGPRGFHIFRVDDYGAPPYPELVVCATRSFLTGHRAAAAELARALQRGYDRALAAPDLGAGTLEREVPGLDPSLVAPELAALRSSFTGPAGRFGVFDLPALRAWAGWETRFGIVRRAPDVAATFDPQLH
jgi:putative hydroxymethylpyrimidine transport system substrate-binding protein